MYFIDGANSAYRLQYKINGLNSFAAVCQRAHWCVCRCALWSDRALSAGMLQRAASAVPHTSIGTAALHTGQSLPHRLSIGTLLDRLLVLVASHRAYVAREFATPAQVLCVLWVGR